MRKLLRTVLPISVFLSAVFALAAASEAATLKVSSFPSGAQVVVDGVNTGKVTPMNVSLTEGDHVVTVQIPSSGWNPDTRTVTIVAGNNDLSVTLLPTATAGSPGPKGDTGDAGPIGPAGPPATRADGPCFDNANRYVDCGNGTVTDTVTGLIWLKQANCFGEATYSAGNQAAAGLKDGGCGLTDGSFPGDWRLPTKAEWDATMAHAAALGCHSPALTNDAGTGCQDVGPSSFGSVPYLFVGYLSSTSSEASRGGFWVASLSAGGAGDGGNKACPCFLVWPVRLGSR